MKPFLFVAGLLHAGFLFAEMFPWSNPYLLCLVSSNFHHHRVSFSGDQLELVSIVVHNAGIYNGIVAGGLFWAASGKASMDVARVMLMGAVVAGVFGAATLAPATAVQAIVGIIGLVLLQKQAQLR
jgi:putative membrane protein